MQISTNTTGMQAGLTVPVDKEGRDHCVVVVKGTFAIGKDGKAHLAEEQAPFVYADVHYGDPGTTSIKYECEFAPFKPRADVIVVGHAVSPGERPVAEVLVRLEVGAVKKQVKVVGDRRWEKGMTGLRASSPVPFSKIPLTFDRAFGGSDHSHENPRYQGTELRNPIGVGFHLNSDSDAIAGTLLPNLEQPKEPVRKWSDTPPPAGFGIIGRGWQPRIAYAGTYDEKWLNECCPFLPQDFDPQYFLSAPADQQLPFFQGGEVVRCTHMTAKGTLLFTVPSVEVPIVYRFRDRDVQTESKLDTLVVEPDAQRFLAIWRASILVGRKLTALREVVVGPPPSRAPHRLSDKPHFKSLADYITWKKKRDRQKA